MAVADVALLAFNFAAFGVLRPWHEAAAEPNNSGSQNGKGHYDSSSRTGAKVFRVFGLVLLFGVYLLAPSASTGAPPPPSRLRTLLFVLLSDTALVPSLFEIARFKRHFELFVGIALVVSATAYNVTNALFRGGAIFLFEDDWHKMNNVLSCTAAVLLSIHLARIRNELQVVVLRYVSFAFITIGQIRDGFWMEGSYWTLPPIVAFGVLLPFWTVMSGRSGRAPLAVTVGSVGGSLMSVGAQQDQVGAVCGGGGFGAPPLLREKLYKGFCCAAMGAVCFWRQLQAAPASPMHDDHHFWHGVFHWWAGGALFFLWGAVPVPARRADSSMAEWQ